MKQIDQIQSINLMSVFVFSIIIYTGGVLAAPGMSLTPKGKVPGGPFKYLQEQIDNIESIPGPQGTDGLDGINCWDINANRSCDVNEDADANGTCDALDCQNTMSNLHNEVCSLYQLTGNPAPSSLISESPEVTCSDGIDNDCDGLFDFSDLDCNQLEICDDGIDNDNDSLTDCSDPDCSLALVCECTPDTYEPNESFFTAVDLGTFTDSPTSFTSVTGNLVPDGDSDWYTFTAMDTDEGIQDSYQVAIELTDNPGREFYIQIWESNDLICSTLTTSGSGLGICSPSGFIGIQGDLFVDDTRVYHVEVMRNPSFDNASCNSYTLNISNGL